VSKAMEFSAKQYLEDWHAFVKLDPGNTARLE
jgi:hypothetical protein